MTETAHESEFDTVAAWTVEALADHDSSFAMAGACRGSGSPAALAWLAESLRVDAETRFVDIGAGLGGPAAWLSEHYQVSPTVCDPMLQATRGAADLFGHRAIQADAESLPMKSGAFDAGWILAVLDTMTWPIEALTEAHRVLTPDGRLGILSYVAQAQVSEADAPEGNQFQTEAELTGALTDAGFLVIERVTAEHLPEAPLDWRIRQQQVGDQVRQRHHTDPRWLEADKQERRFAELLSQGRVTTVLLHAMAV